MHLKKFSYIPTHKGHILWYVHMIQENNPSNNVSFYSEANKLLWSKNSKETCLLSVESSLVRDNRSHKALSRSHKSLGRIIKCIFSTKSFIYSRPNLASRDNNDARAFNLQMI